MTSNDDGSGVVSVSLTREFLRIREADAQIQHQRAGLMNAIETWLSHQSTYIQQLKDSPTALHVGAAIQALPGKELIQDDGECYKQDDRGIVKRLYINTDGQDAVEIDWPRTGKVISVIRSTLLDDFKLLSEASANSQHRVLARAPSGETQTSTKSQSTGNNSSPKGDGNQTVDDSSDTPNTAVNGPDDDQHKTSMITQDDSDPSKKVSFDNVMVGDSQEHGEGEEKQRFSDHDFEKHHRKLSEYMAYTAQEEEKVEDTSFCGPQRAVIDKCMNNAVVETVISAFILINSIIVGQEVDWTVSNPGEEPPDYFLILGHCFNLLFLVEVALRMFASGKHFALGRQRLWNLFDTVLVGFSLMEVILHWIVGFNANNMSSMRVVRLVRIGRILRVVRVARMMRLLLALRLLIIQIVSTLRACFWALVLLMLIIYLFAMVFAQVCSQHLNDVGMDPELMRYWGTVPRSMYTLYKSVTGGVDWENVAFELSKVHFMWVVVFNIFLAFTTFAVLNVVVGVFCQSAVESAAHDYENIINVKIREKNDFLSKVTMLFNDIDSSGDGNISFAELESHLCQDHVKAYFEHLGLDPEDAWDLFKIIDSDESSEVSLDEFTTGCIRLKGPAKVIDVEKLNYASKHLNKRLVSFMHDSREALDELKAIVDQSRGTLKQLSWASENSQAPAAWVSETPFIKTLYKEGNGKTPSRLQVYI